MKLVKELLYEHLNYFIEDSDPVEDMGIGMKPIVEKWLRDNGVINYFLSKRNLYINTYTSVLLEQRELEELPPYIRFNHIMGGFHIRENNLKNLKGCPYSVTGSFIASKNELKNLENGPYKVEGSYGASSNNLESLKGIARKIGKSIYINDNNLTNLQYIPSHIEEDLYIYHNPINTLKWFPSEIRGSLKYTPSKVLTKENIQKVCRVWGHFIEVM